MHISKISYARTVNLGNFNSTRFEAEITIEPGDDLNQANDELRDFVNSHIEEIRQDLTQPPTTIKGE